MKITLIAATLLLLAAGGSAVAGPYQKGYGGGQWGGKDGTGIEAGKGGNTRGSGQCNRCEDIDYDNPRSVSVTRNSHSLEGSVGAAGPAPTGSVTLKSGSTSTTTTYGRTSRGVDADGRNCPCK